MLRNKILGIGSVFLASVALFLLISTPYYPALGDLLLEKVGLRAWSHGDTGFHLTLIYCMVLVCIGFMGMAEYLYNEYPKIRNKGKWLVLGAMIILVTGSNKYAEFSKSMQPGLKAIQFLYDESNFEYEYEGEKILNARGLLEFKNYSNTSRSFYVKYIPDDELSSQFSKKEFIGFESGKESSKLIQVAPKSTSKIKVDFNQNMILSNGDKVSSGSGSQSIQTIIIYNDQEQVKFTGDTFMGITVVN